MGRRQRSLFEDRKGVVRVKADATVLALGGASWPRLGSDGGWVEILRAQGIAVDALAACKLRILASAGRSIFRDRFEGAAPEAVALSFAGETRAARS